MEVRNRFSAFKNNVPFNDRILEINSLLIDNAEYLDAVKSNLIEYTKNYIKNNR